MVLLNRGSGTTTISTSASQIGLGSGNSYSVRDLWAHSTGTTSGAISASVPAHGAAMFVVSGGGASPTSFSLVSQSSGRCMDIAGNSQTNGTLAQIWDCHGQVNQRFTTTAAGELRVYNGTKCLDVHNQETANGTAVLLWDCNGQANQRFRLNSDGTITAVGSGRCLDVDGAVDANGTKVIIWDCHGGANQRWTRT